MATSILFAKVIGLVMSIAGVSMLIDGKRMEKIMQEFLGSEALMFLMGYLTFIVGSLMVLTHSVWASDWRVFVTLICWIVFAKGVFQILLPDYSARSAKALVKGNFMKIAPVFCLLIGLYFLYVGVSA